VKILKDVKWISISILNLKSYKNIFQLTASSEANNKVKGYCFDCHKNFNENNSDEHKEHTFKSIESMINFIKDMNLKEIEIEKSGTKSENIVEVSTTRYKDKNGNMIQRRKNMIHL